MLRAGWAGVRECVIDKVQEMSRSRRWKELEGYISVVVFVDDDDDDADYNNDEDNDDDNEMEGAGGACVCRKGGSVCSFLFFVFVGV